MKKPSVAGTSPNFQKFFDWSFDYLVKHNKNLTIVNTATVKLDDNKRCMGWCDSYEIMLGRKNPLFEKVYVHEFSHMTQNVEKAFEGSNYSLFWDHMDAGTLDPFSYKHVLEVIDLERDCEARALKFSDKWDLFDREEYCKQANLYLYYYQYLFLTKKWVKTTTIYRPQLMAQMPPQLVPMSHFKFINMDMMKLFHDCLIPKGEFYKKGFTNK